MDMSQLEQLSVSDLKDLVIRQLDHPQVNKDLLLEILTLLKYGPTYVSTTPAVEVVSAPLPTLPVLPLLSDLAVANAVVTAVEKSLKDMTVKDLKDLAKARGIKSYSTLKKDELIARLEGRPLSAVVVEVVEAPRPSSALQKMTVADLKARAKLEGIKGYSTLKKDELIAKLSGQAVASRPASRGSAGARPASVARPPSAEVNVETLENANITALKKIAKDEGITGVSKFKADEVDQLKAIIFNNRNKMDVVVVAQPGDEFRSMTVKQLKDLAKAEGIVGYSTMKKDDLIYALTAGNKGKGKASNQNFDEKVMEFIDDEGEEEDLENLTFNQLMKIAQREMVDLTELPRGDIEELRERIYEQRRNYDDEEDEFEDDYEDEDE